ncbi:TPA: diguanylate cyclase [Vibrio cholerae]|nr:diguanylate cyclase [Vibrio cholerae]
MNICSLHTAIYHSLMEQIAVIDAQGQIVDVNRAWVEFGQNNGVDEQYDWININYLDALYKASQAGETRAFEAYQGIKAVIQGQSDSYYHEYPCHSPNEQRWFLMRVVPLKIEQYQYWVLSHHNITQRKLAEMRSEFQATHDPLTGLANRRHFHQQLEALLLENQQQQAGLCLMMIDLDNFKHFNDTHGHQAGDLCLVRIAATLQHNLSVPCTAYRLGGDEFALLLSHLTQQQSQDIAASVSQRIQELRLLCGNKLQVTASIGGIFISGETQISSHLLINETDQTLYQVKRGTKNSYLLTTLSTAPHTVASEILGNELID